MIYDAIWKKHYLKNYNLSPMEFDDTPAMLIRIWNKIAEKENEKERNKQQ
jgi:hypothetical protein